MFFYCSFFWLKGQEFSREKSQLYKLVWKKKPSTFHVPHMKTFKKRKEKGTLYVEFCMSLKIF
jgi:hypothetical protein